MAYSSSKPVTGGSLVAADIRENFRALKEDGIVVATDASISQAKLKTSQTSVSMTGTSGMLTLTGGEYGFFPRLKASATTSGILQLADGSNSLTTSYVTKVYVNTNSANTVYVQQRFVTSSGEIFWIFILRDKVTKDIIAMSQAPDHPCFGNGGKPELVPHPFNNVDFSTQEIIVINPTQAEVDEMKKKCEKGEDEPDKDLLEIITEEYEIDENAKPKWPSIPVTVGLPRDYGSKAM